MAGAKAEFDNSTALRLSGSPGIEVPASDPREHEVAQLPNGMQCMAVCDPEADKAAIAVAVQVGQLSDPANVMGLAHFCEHMTFMGTDKFPDENEWSSWLQEHGGMSNAYTASERTVYYCNVLAPHLRPAMERFSRFFVAPLMKEDGVARELRAVDSEHAKNKTSDTWREHQLNRSTANPKHVYHMFGTGDSRTLRDQPEAEGLSVREELLKFHKENYVARRMHVCVVGRQPTSELLEMCAACFAGMQDDGAEAPNAAVPEFPPDAYMPEQLGRLQRMVPVTERRSVKVIWPVPVGHAARWRSKPAGLVSHLIGHEGAGSLLSHLKAKGWAVGLMAGPSDSLSSFQLFSVTVDLTPAGLEHHAEVVDAVYRYVRLLRETGPQRWVFDECAAVAAASFRFMPRQAPSSYASAVAAAMTQYPAPQAVSGNALFRDYDPESYTDYLRHLTPSNSRVRLVAQDECVASLCDRSEPWYDTRFGDEPIPAELRARWEACLSGAQEEAAQAEGGVAPLAMPAANPFIATDFSLVHQGEPGRLVAARAASEAAAQANEKAAGGGEAGEEEGDDAAAWGVWLEGVRQKPEGSALVVEPTPVLDDDRGLVLWGVDDWFGKPHAGVQVSFASPAAYASPECCVMTSLALELIKETLSEFAYDAEVAELSYEIFCTDNGLGLVVQGFSHKLPLLLEKVLERIGSFSFTDEEYARHFDLRVRTERARMMQSPVHRSLYEATVARKEPMWHTAQKIRALEALGGGPEGAAAVRAFAGPDGELFRRGFAQGLVYGNLGREAATAAAEQIVSVFRCNRGGARSPPRLTRAERESSQMRSRGTQLPTEAAARIIVRAGSPDDSNAAVHVHLQTGADCSATAMRLELLTQFLREPAFDQLRTKETLGYIVALMPRALAGATGLSLLVQSNRLDPQGLEERVEAFLTQAADVLAAVSDGEWRQAVMAVASDLRQPVSNATQMARQLWAEIDAGTFQFDRVRQDVNALLDITREDLLAFFASRIAFDGSERRKLSVQVLPSAEQDQTWEDQPEAWPRCPDLGRKTSDPTPLLAAGGNVGAGGVTVEFAQGDGEAATALRSLLGRVASPAVVGTALWRQRRRAAAAAGAAE